MTTEALELALQLAQRGISILPIRADGSKAPDGECLPGAKTAGRPGAVPTEDCAGRKHPQLVGKWTAAGNCSDLRRGFRQSRGSGYRCA